MFVSLIIRSPPRPCPEFPLGLQETPVDWLGLRRHRCERSEKKKFRRNLPEGPVVVGVGPLTVASGAGPRRQVRLVQERLGRFDDGEHVDVRQTGRLAVVVGTDTAIWIGVQARLWKKRLPGYLHVVKSSASRKATKQRCRICPRLWRYRRHLSYLSGRKLDLLLAPFIPHNHQTKGSAMNYI